MKNHRLYAVCVVMFGLVCSAPAWSVALLLGPGPGTEFETQHDLDMGGWTIGTPDNRIRIEADPEAGAWIKNLDRLLYTDIDIIVSTNNGTPEGPMTYFIHEYLTVGSLGLEWTDWHEEIISGPESTDGFKVNALAP